MVSPFVVRRYVRVRREFIHYIFGLKNTNENRYMSFRLFSLVRMYVNRQLYNLVCCTSDSFLCTIIRICLSQVTCG